MNAIQKTLAKLFGFNTNEYKETYTYEVYVHVKKLYNQFYDYYRPQKKDMSYIVKTIVEAQLLIELCDAAQNSPFGRSIMTQFKRENAKVNPLNATAKSGVLFAWSKGEYDFVAVNLSETVEVEALVKNSRRVVTISDVPDSALYKAYVQVTALHRHVRKTAYWNQASDPQIDLLSVHQEVVDYILKLSAIGEDSAVFNALTKRDNEWIKTFFKPLILINQQLKLIPTDASIADTNSGDNKLDTIVSWSTPKIKPLEDLMIEQPRPQQAYKLFDPNLYSPKQPLAQVVVDELVKDFPELSIVQSPIPKQKSIQELAEQDQTDWAKVMELTQTHEKAGGDH